MRVTALLARLRVPLGFLFGAFVLAAARPTRASLLAGAAVAALGESLRIWAAGHLNKSQEVTSSGPYRWLAHPLYVGSAIMGVGLAIASANVVVAVGIGLYLVTTMAAAVGSEETFLRERFGDRYERYRRGEVGADPDGLSRRFSLARVTANREHRAAVGLLVAVLLLVLKATYNGLFWEGGR
jgi:hypothetical protein